jgi:cell wall-associated NlpC family hydrolase
MSWVLKGPAQRFEPREWFAGPEVVELALAGEIGAVRYVEPKSLVCTAPRVTVRSAPDAAAEASSELLFGEDFEIADVKAGFALGRSGHDRYIGWVPLDALALPGAAPTHRVTARRAPVFAPMPSGPSIKAAVRHELPFAARVAGTMVGDFLALAGGGFLHRRHVETAPADRFAAAALFMGAPYLWGGRTPDGVDCSGLVQQALAAEGITLRRDTDLQRAEGETVPFRARTSGDLMFWPGHVGLLLDGDELCHANAFWMAVVTEPLADVIARAGAEPEVRRFA